MLTPDRPHSQNLRSGRISLPHQVYLLTTVTCGREPVLSDFYQARLLIDVLRRQQEEGLVDSLAFVAMPDHLHWLVELKKGALATLMQQVKGASARRINAQRGRTGALWQPGYHDRAIRRDEDLRAVARYLVGNPIRTGLVARVMDYPHWDTVWVEG